MQGLARPSAHVILAWVYKPCLGLQAEGGSTSLAWVCKPSVGKTSARKVDRHSTLNSAPTRSAIKKGGLGLGPWARSRPRPGPARTSYLHGSTRLAWVYKSSMGLLYLPESISVAWVYKLAWVYKSSVGL